MISRLLHAIRGALKPDGQLLITTPNKWSPEGLAGYYWDEKTRGGEKWMAWDPTHVHIYSSAEILRLLKSVGFAVDTITGYYYKGRLPIVGDWALPFSHAKRFPLNRLGFNIMVQCHRR
jgi:SAM-dependent methyltransferase